MEARRSSGTGNQVKGGRDWLFKFPQPNTGQHWAEKIAAEIAGRLGIRHARVELAVADARRGSVTESFAGPGVDLWHGNQVLTGADHSYDREATFRHSSHTLKRIWDALEHVFTNPDWARRAKLKIADYIVLDAVIGNTDRHHENWGILRRRVRARLIGRMAPSFDHASALGRELLDERRKLLLDANRVGDYVAKGAVAGSTGRRRMAAPPVRWSWYGTLQMAIRIFFHKHSAGWRRWTSRLSVPLSAACQPTG